MTVKLARNIFPKNKNSQIFRFKFTIITTQSNQNTPNTQKSKEIETQWNHIEQKQKQKNAENC